MDDPLYMENTLDRIEETNVEILNVLKDIRDMMKQRVIPKDITFDEWHKIMSKSIVEILNVLKDINYE